MQRILLPGLIAILLHANPVLAHNGAPIPSAYGTATIDGVQGASEWAAASPRAVFATGTLAGSLLYVMDDHVNLYVGLFVPDGNFQANDIFWVRFDAKHDGVATAGEDEINGSSGTFFDSHFDGASWAIFDPHPDGASAAALAPGGVFFEMKHPLNSGDPNDMYVNVGDTFGICAFYSNNGTIFGSDVYPQGCLVAGPQTDYVDYTISPGQTGVGERVASAPRITVVPDPVRVGGEVAIHYSIPAGGARVQLGLYSIAGRKLVDLGEGESEPGEHVLKWFWPERALGRGVYFVRAHYDGMGNSSSTLIVQ